MVHTILSKITESFVYVRRSSWILTNLSNTTSVSIFSKCCSNENFLTTRKTLFDSFYPQKHCFVFFNTYCLMVSTAGDIGQHCFFSTKIIMHGPQKWLQIKQLKPTFQDPIYSLTEEHLILIGKVNGMKKGMKSGSQHKNFQAVVSCLQHFHHNCDLIGSLQQGITAVSIKKIHPNIQSFSPTSRVSLQRGVTDI